MISIELYEKCIQYAKKIINKYNLILDPLDVVHDIIINPELSSEIDYYSAIKGLLIETKNTPYTENISKYNANVKTSYNICCKKCLEVYPMDMFQYGYNKITRRKNTRKFCKKCFAAEMKLYRQTDVYKKYQRDYHKDYMKEYRKKTKDNTAKLRIKKFWDKQKKEISDKYVIKLLCEKGKNKRNNITSEMINIKRESIIKYRIKKQHPL